jgi:hypothetical protein
MHGARVPEKLINTAERCRRSLGELHTRGTKSHGLGIKLATLVLCWRALVVHLVIRLKTSAASLKHPRGIFIINNDACLVFQAGSNGNKMPPLKTREPLSFSLRLSCVLMVKLKILVLGYDFRHSAYAFYCFLNFALICILKRLKFYQILLKSYRMSLKEPIKNNFDPGYRVNSRENVSQSR